MDTDADSVPARPIRPTPRVRAAESTGAQDLSRADWLARGEGLVALPSLHATPLPTLPTPGLRVTCSARSFSDQIRTTPGDKPLRASRLARFGQNLGCGGVGQFYVRFGGIRARKISRRLGCSSSLLSFLRVRIASRAAETPEDPRKRPNAPLRRDSGSPTAARVTCFFASFSDQKKINRATNPPGRGWSTPGARARLVARIGGRFRPVPRTSWRDSGPIPGDLAPSTPLSPDLGTCVFASFSDQIRAHRVPNPPCSAPSWPRSGCAPRRSCPAPSRSAAAAARPSSGRLRVARGPLRARSGRLARPSWPIPGAAPARPARLRARSRRSPRRLASRASCRPRRSSSRLPTHSALRLRRRRPARPPARAASPRQTASRHHSLARLSSRRPSARPLARARRRTTAWFV